jgi:hypothetical protein
MPFSPNNIPWNKGKTKLDCPTLSKSGVKRGNIPWNLGKKCKPHTKEWKEFMSKRLKGVSRPLEVRLKISKSHFGIKHTEATKNKLKQYRGERASGWKGGITDMPYADDWTKTLKRSIRERDNYTCGICKRKQDKGDKITFHVHHIDYNKLNCNPINLITLCITCHTKTNHRRSYWETYFFNNKLDDYKHLDDYK